MTAGRDRITAAFTEQADVCRRMGSPFTGDLLNLLKDQLDPDSPVGQAVFGWPGDPYPDALALRLAGALHGLALDGSAPDLTRAYPPARSRPEALWTTVETALEDHAARICAWLERPPQTNEVARSAMLLPGLLDIARHTGKPLCLLEIGASGGLNLQCDRFAVRYGDVAWGNAASPVRLAPEVRGTPPPLSGDLQVTARAGCDANPLNPGNAEDRLRLTAFTWPDQPDRLQRLAAALDIAANADMRIDRVDAADWVEARLAARPENCCTVLFHTVVWQYLPDDTQARIESALRSAGETADVASPLAWLRMEGTGGRGFAQLEVTLWPGGERRHLANCDWHGRWIEWLDPPVGL